MRQVCARPPIGRVEPFDLGVNGSDRLVGELVGGTGHGAHALINSSVTLEAGMMASSRASSGADRQGWSNVACAGASQSTPDAYRGRAATGRIRGHSDRPARPKLGVRPAAPSHGELRGGVASGLWRCGLSPPRRGLIQERARSPGHRPDLVGQRACVGAARRRPDVRAGGPWPRTRPAVASSGRQPHPGPCPAWPTGGEYGERAAMQLRLGCARLLDELVGASQQAKGGDAW